MRSMTDEGCGAAIPGREGATAVGSLCDTPHPTFANANAIFSRKGRRN
jgi:hypothetical protein